VEYHKPFLQLTNGNTKRFCVTCCNNVSKHWDRKQNFYSSHIEYILFSVFKWITKSVLMKYLLQIIISFYIFYSQVLGCFDYHIIYKYFTLNRINNIICPCKSLLCVFWRDFFEILSTLLSIWWILNILIQNYLQNANVQ
jgi:hypothetical protein